MRDGTTENMLSAKLKCKELGVTLTSMTMAALYMAIASEYIKESMS